MKQKLLLYGFTDIFSEGEIISAIKTVNANSEIEVFRVDKNYYSVPIGYFAESDLPPNDSEMHPGDEFSDRMIILCGLDSLSMDTVLAALRGAGFGAEILKAVLTPVNKLWTPAILLDELKRERAAFAQMNRK